MPPENEEKETETKDEPQMVPLAEVQKMIADAVAKETKGLKANKEQLLAEKKALEGKANPFLSLGVEAEEAEKALELVKSQNFKKLVEAGDFDKLTEQITKDVEKRAEKQWREQVAKANSEKDELGKASEVLKKELRQIRVLDRIKDAAIKAGVSPSAIEDAVLSGERLFDLDEEGKCCAFKDGERVPGKEGWLTPEEWLTNIKPDKLHWWGQTKVAGAPGSPEGGGGAGKRTYTRAEYDKLPAAEQRSVALKANAGEVSIVDQ